MMLGKLVIHMEKNILDILLHIRYKNQFWGRWEVYVYVNGNNKTPCRILAFSSKEAKVQLSFVVQNPGSSNTSHFYHATHVQPKWDQICISSVHLWESPCHVCPGPKNWHPGSVSIDRQKLIKGKCW